MRAQEVVTIFSDIPADGKPKTYHELDEWIAKGMYIERFTQTQSDTSGRYILTFLLRYYNTTISKDKI